MKMRNVLGLAVTAVTLGTLGVPSAVASPGTVSFAGTFQITPTVGGIDQTAQFCFAATATCPNEIVSTGVATGSSTDPLVIDGLYVQLRHKESCLGPVIAPTALPATMAIQVHDLASDSWVDVDGASTWARAGLVVLISGVAQGTAYLTPVGVPACGAPITFAVEGDLTLVA